ncbi:MAG: hypothetical protein ABII82_07690 [Verrucomicrobiota bacterium]
MKIATTNKHSMFKASTLVGCAIGGAGIASATPDPNVVFTPESPHITGSQPGFISASSFNFLSGEVTDNGPTSPTYIAFGLMDEGKPSIFHDGSTYTEDGIADFYSYNAVLALESGGGSKAIALLSTNTEIDFDFFFPPQPSGGEPGGPMHSDWIGEGTTQGFVGFSYTTNVDVEVDFSTTTLFGWAEFAYDSPSDTLALLSFGFNTEGNSVFTPETLTNYTAPSAIPEPASFGLAAAMLAGSAALGRRRLRAA